MGNKYYKLDLKTVKKKKKAPDHSLDCGINSIGKAGHRELRKCCRVLWLNIGGVVEIFSKQHPRKCVEVSSSFLGLDFAFCWVGRGK